MSKPSQNRFVKSIGILSSEVIHYLFASFARIPLQSVDATKTTGCTGIVVHRLHQYSTHVPRRLVFTRVPMGGVMRMDVSVWVDRALVVVVVVMVLAAAVQLRFPAVFRIGRWCNVARRPGTGLPFCPPAYCCLEECHQYRDSATFWQVRPQVSVSVYIICPPATAPGTWDRAAPVS